MWIVNAQSIIVCSEMLKLWRNNKNIKMLGVPRNTLPLVIYIGIFFYWVLLDYNMSFKTIAGGFDGAFWWYRPLSEDREFFFLIYQNYLVALSHWQFKKLEFCAQIYNYNLCCITYSGNTYFTTRGKSMRPARNTVFFLHSFPSWCTHHCWQYLA